MTWRSRCCCYRVLCLEGGWVAGLETRIRILDEVSWNEEGQRTRLTLVFWIGTMNDIFHCLLGSLAFSMCSPAIRANWLSFIACGMSKRFPVNTDRSQLLTFDLSLAAGDTWLS